MEVVIGKSDLIVVGEIEAVKTKSYKFRVSNMVKGTSDSLIHVNMFREWTCDARGIPPVKGQKLILFLVKKGDRYEIVNGSTGEKFIMGDNERVRGTSCKCTIDEYASGIRQFISCYYYVENPGATWGTFKQLRTDEEIGAIDNDFSKELFARMERYTLAE